MSRRILLLVSAMMEGGAERVAAALANEWVRVGDHVTLMATYSGRGTCRYPLAAGVRMTYLADEAGVVGRGLLGYLRRFWALRRFITREQPDVVVAFLTNVNVAVLMCSFGLRVPVIVSERIYPPAYPVGRVLEGLRRLLYPRAAKVVMQTSIALDWLSREIPRASGIVIPNPVLWPLPKVEPVVLPSEVVGNDRRVLLAVGRLHAQKGFDLLLAAFARIARRFPDWDLIVIGEGPERVALEYLRRDLCLDGRVVFPGHIGNLGDWYSASSVYVLSSRFEGFPNSLAEAMAYGCPPISFDCDTGPRDIIDDGVSGLIVPVVGDVPALADVMEKMMRDGELRSMLSDSAVKVRTKLSIGHICDSWNSAFDEVLSRGV